MRGIRATVQRHVQPPARRQIPRDEGTPPAAADHRHPSDCPGSLFLILILHYVFVLLYYSRLRRAFSIAATPTAAWR